MRRRYFVLFVFMLLLCGCSASGRDAKLVAAFPQGERYPNAAAMCAQTGYPGDACHAYMVISTLEPLRVAGRAEDLVESYRGYRVDGQPYSCSTGKGYTLVLAVPGEHFEVVLKSLRRLGRVEYETTWREGPPGYRDGWARVVLELRPSARAAWPRPENNWNPVTTFLSALRVAFLIFRVLVDVLIWVLVVAGPFAFVWLGLRALQRRLRSKG